MLNSRYLTLTKCKFTNAKNDQKYATKLWIMQTHQNANLLKWKFTKMQFYHKFLKKICNKTMKNAILLKCKFSKNF